MRKFEPPTCLLLVWALLGCALLAPASYLGAEEDPFPLEPWDVIYTRSGGTYTGRILQEEGGIYTIQIRNSRSKMPIPKADVTKVVRRQDAEQAVEARLKEAQANPQALAALAQKAVARFPNNEAVRNLVIKFLQVKADSGDPEVLFILADRLVASNEADKALKIVERIIARKDSAKARALEGQALAKLGKAEESLKAFRRSYEMDPADEAVLVAFAQALLNSGRAPEARKLFTDALEKNPRQVSALAGQGYVRLRQGEFAEAAASFTQALEIESGNLRAKIGLAACKILRQDYDEAIRLCEEVLNFDNKNAQAYGLQGYALYMKGGVADLPKALRKIEESLREAPDDPRVRTLKAVVLARQAEVLAAEGDESKSKDLRREAERILADVEKSDAEDAWLQYLMAETRFQQALEESQGSLFEQAAKGFRRAAQLAPTYAPAQQAVGAVSLRLRKWVEAEEAYKRASELDPANAEYHAGRGLALLGQKNLQAAQTLLKKARELDPKNVSALCGLGYIANFEKNEASAKSFFQQALNTDGQCAYAAAALKKIHGQRGLHLEYLSFEAGDPPGWRAAKSRTIKPEVEGGKIRWRGTMTSAAARDIEYTAVLEAADFVEVSADLEIKPECPASLTLKLASKQGSGIRFFVEFGKDEGSNLAYRYRDYSGGDDAWRSLGVQWPKEGRMRLGLGADPRTGADLSSGGVVCFFVNGENKGSLTLKLKSVAKLEVGVSASIPARANIDASADNIALLIRPASGSTTTVKEGELQPPEPESEKGSPNGTDPGPANPEKKDKS